MKVAVLGKGGQLASEFEILKKNNNDWMFYSINEIDITNFKLVTNFFKLNKFDLIINCAAFTNVENAEINYQLADKVNNIGVQNILYICKFNNTKLIHYSTDYVFDGDSSVPYIENDITNPINLYGKSKLDGENAIIKSNVKSIIIRTSWVYSTFGNNFVKTMLNFSQKEKLNVVHDQIGSPTSAEDLAIVSLSIIENNDYQWKIGDIFHFSNEGKCSWFEFAEEIFKIDKSEIKLIKTNSKNYKFLAKRPKNSQLNTNKISKKFNIRVKHWKQSLERVLNNNKKQGK